MTLTLTKNIMYLFNNNIIEKNVQFHEIGTTCYYPKY